MDYDFLTRLLEKLQLYEEQSDNSTVDMYDFAEWLLQRRDLSDGLHQERKNLLDWHGKGRGGKVHYNVSNLLTAIGRYKMNYVRQALEGTLFDTYDEFAFMLSLVFKGDYTPSKLIETHIQLKPTGMEVIKRLLKKGLAEQRPSDIDKRSKVLSATDLGRNVFYSTMRRVNLITDMVMSPVSEEECMLLLALLQKLDRPHRALYSLDRKLSFRELLTTFGIEQSVQSKNEKE